MSLKVKHNFGDRYKGILSSIDAYRKLFIIRNVRIIIILHLIVCIFYCTGCAKKKKDILNIYVKSQIINIFF